MYDKERVEDSLRVCEQIKKEKASNVLTTEKLFSDMSRLTESNSGHPWEKYIDTHSENKYIDIPDTFDFDNREDDSEVSFSRKVISNIIMLTICICVSFVLTNLITNHIAHQTTVEGHSMQPVLDDGDSIIIERVSYFFGEPERYDIVVFPVDSKEESEEKVYYVKRIIGMPGDIVQIIDGHVYVNGLQLKDDIYGKADIIDAGIVSNPVQLAEDEYFVLGDNRNMSSDSRYEIVGMVKRSEISGKAFCCIWPFKDFKKL